MRSSGTMRSRSRSFVSLVAPPSAPCGRTIEGVASKDAPRFSPTDVGVGMGAVRGPRYLHT